MVISSATIDSRKGASGRTWGVWGWSRGWLSAHGKIFVARKTVLRFRDFGLCVEGFIVPLPKTPREGPFGRERVTTPRERATSVVKGKNVIP